MRRLTVPSYCHEQPLASGVFQHLPDPSLLYLSGLFHDIAKGRRGDHSDLGATDALAFCTLHGLPEKDSELVSWLVKSHLLMSITAQRKDLGDPDVIGEFATQVNNLERLDYLYLLTVSDIRATNPKLWNDWKDKLLSELYYKTAILLNKGIGLQSDRETNILEIQTSSLRRLEQLGIDSHQTHEFWKTLNTEYFQSHTPGEIVWHTTLINEAKQKHSLNTPLVQTRVDKSSRSIELLVYMTDRDNIFYDIVTDLSNSEVDIVNAQIINGSDGHALETFRLIPVNSNNSELTLAADQIIHRLRDRLINNSIIRNAPVAVSGKHKYFSSPTILAFKNTDDSNATHLTIETIDRTGILAIIAKTFSKFKIKIINARITTAGEKAIDHFIVSSSENSALSTEQQDNLKKQLEEVL
jgi:[protein-PII] uridylyltransferase